MASIMKTLIVVSCVAVAAVLGYVVGLRAGITEEQHREQLRIDYAPAAAEELLRRGEIGTALKQLYIAKANEQVEGLLDAELGKAYAAAKRPCLATYFLESSFEFMRRERLDASPKSDGLQRLLDGQRSECSRQLPGR